MSTYENLYGRRVNVVSSNPSNPKEGEVWYNSTLGQLKGYVLGVGAWAAGTNLPSARGAGGGTRVGTKDAFAIFGAYISDPTGTETEEYNGTAWSGGGAMGT